MLVLDRATYIGGSDVAAVLGISPWLTPLQLWERKVGLEPSESLDPQKQKFFARRKRQEPIIAEMLADEYGVEVTRLSMDSDQNRYQDREHSFMAAEIDYEFILTDKVKAHFPEREDFARIPSGTLLNGEIKTVHPFKASEWGEQGSEEIPAHYAAQAMHGLGVTRRPACLVAALFGLDGLAAFPVVEDAPTIAGMRERCVSFWHDHVLANVPPAPSNMPELLRALKGVTGFPVELDDAHASLLRQIFAARKELAALKRDLEDAEYQLLEYIAVAWGGGDQSLTKDNALLTHGGATLATWSRQAGAYLDQKRLKQDQPELVESYTVRHTYRVLREKKGKS